MVEVTYQMVLSTLQTVGLLIGIFYYIMTLNNQEKTRKYAEETRKIQTALHIAQRSQTPELGLVSLELYDMTWTDFDDFLRKYDSTINPENYAKRTQVFNMLEEAGYLLSQGLYDIETLYELANPSGNIVLWEKFKPVIMGYRERYNDPNRNQWSEFLIEEYKKERMRRGLSADPNDADRVIHHWYKDEKE
jgi:hypothetical protein